MTREAILIGPQAIQPTMDKLKNIFGERQKIAATSSKG